MELQADVPLAPLTSLQLGGRARWLVEARDTASLLEALRFAEQRGTRLALLGGGSNLVVADEGFDGLVLRVALRGVERSLADGRAIYTVQAGESFDALVADSVARGDQGLECMSGIPGSVGATPVQNVGAYGQEVADTVVGVEVWDRTRGARRWLEPGECAFRYRDSRLKREPERRVVLAVRFALRPGAPPCLRYPELARAVGEGATLGQVRQTVLALRGAKSMLLDAADPNGRSAGSFFVNPLVDTAQADEVVRRAEALGIDAAGVPRWPQPDGRVKLSGGWLIERAGIAKGLRMGPVGVSSRHALALVHHGGGRTADLLRLARHVRATVQDRFAVTLVPEPVFLGFPAGDPLDADT